jgi:hypothetical protein
MDGLFCCVGISNDTTSGKEVCVSKHVNDKILFVAHFDCFVIGITALLLLPIIASSPKFSLFIDWAIMSQI